jgi:hypothetical protein
MQDDERDIIEALGQALEVTQALPPSPRTGMVTGALFLAIWLRLMRLSGVPDDEARERLRWVADHAAQLGFAAPDDLYTLLQETRH